MEDYKLEYSERGLDEEITASTSDELYWRINSLLKELETARARRIWVDLGGRVYLSACTTEQ